MTDPTPDTPPAPTPPPPPPPTPVVRPRRRSFPVVYLVPILALAAAGYYLYQHLGEQGPEITLTFDSAEGLRPNESLVTVRGVQVGKVTDVGLSEDRTTPLVSVRLKRDFRDLAREGTRFWIVRPQVSLESISGLSTVLSGPRIEALPASAGGSAPDAATGVKAASEALVTRFTGLRAPPQGDPADDGVPFVLRTPRAPSLSPGTPLFYRGIQIGAVRSTDLAPDAAHVRVTVAVRPRYRNLVRTNSVFFSVGGANAEGGIFSGVKVRVDSLRSLLSGGLALATPESNLGDQAPPNHEFFLNDSPKDEWLEWTPRIQIEP